MSDWEGELSVEEQAVWEAFVRNARADAAQKISESAFVMSIVPREEADIKFCVELGLAIMHDKPLMLVALPGTTIPHRLSKVADVICVADIDTAEGREEIARAMKEMTG